MRVRRAWPFLPAANDFWTRHTKFRFLVVGGWNTLFGYAVFAVLYQMLHSRMHYLLIGLLAHVLASLQSFATHRLIVFKSQGAVLAELFRFNVSVLLVLTLATIGLWLLVSGIGLHPLLAQALIAGVAVAVSYLAHRHFSFARLLRHDSRKRADERKSGE